MKKSAVLLSFCTLLCLWWTPAFGQAPRDMVETACGKCHPVEKICSSLTRNNSTWWTNTVLHMVDKGAKLTTSEGKEVALYLSQATHAQLPACASAAASASSDQTGTSPGMKLFIILAHPALMGGVLLIALGVAHSGISRLRATLLGVRVVFPWKIHVLLGKMVMLLWGAGFMGGLNVSYIKYKQFGATGLHYNIALIMLALMVVVFSSGYFMDVKKKARKALPLFHGLCSMILLVLAFWQVSTGIGIIRSML